MVKNTCTILKLLILLSKQLVIKTCWADDFFLHLLGAVFMLACGAPHHSIVLFSPVYWCLHIATQLARTGVCVDMTIV